MSGWALVPPSQSHEGSRPDELDLGGIKDGERWVCRFGDSTQYYPSEGTPPNGADGALMIAAPELLEALEAMTVLAEGPTGGVTQQQKREVLAIARAAIAKARGEA